MVFGVLLSLFGQVSAAAQSKWPKSKGWGEKYNWLPLDEGLKLASKQRKPMMVIVHSMHCPSCIQLKKKFAIADSVQAMGDKFVMVNVEATEAPVGEAFSPDGAYVPRILFFTPDGKLMKNVHNEYRYENKFTYSHPAFMIESMVNAMKINGKR